MTKPDTEIANKLILSVFVSFVMKAKWVDLFSTSLLKIIAPYQMFIFLGSPSSIFV